MKVTFEFGESEKDEKRMLVMCNALLNMPPDDLQIGRAGELKRPPRVTLHCDPEKKEEALSNMSLDSSVEDVHVKELPEKDEDVKELNQHARRLMKDLTTGGMSLKELKAHLDGLGDLTKLDGKGIKKAINIMEGLLVA